MRGPVAEVGDDRSSGRRLRIDLRQLADDVLVGKAVEALSPKERRIEIPMKFVQDLRSWRRRLRGR
jgi:hypothetical protein